MKHTNTETRGITESNDEPMKNTGPVLVAPEVLDGLEAVRRSGLTNMLDRPRVVEIAEEFGFEEAARWITSHHHEFAIGILRGFRILQGKRSTTRGTDGRPEGGR